MKHGPSLLQRSLSILALIVEAMPRYSFRGWLNMYTGDVHFFSGFSTHVLEDPLTRSARPLDVDNTAHYSNLLNAGWAAFYFTGREAGATVSDATSNQLRVLRECFFQNGVDPSTPCILVDDVHGTRYMQVRDLGHPRGGGGSITRRYRYPRRNGDN